MVSATDEWIRRYRGIDSKSYALLGRTEPSVNSFSMYKRVLFRKVRESIERRLRSRSPIRVWSAGSGIDLISLKLKYVFGNRVDITILDVSEECIAANEVMFKEAGMAARFVVGDILQSSYVDEFDIVMNTGLLEHFETREQEELISIFSKSLVSGGSYMTLTPYRGGRLYAYYIRKGAQKGHWTIPETPVHTLKGLGSVGFGIVEEYPTCAIDQLGLVRIAYPKLGLLGWPLERIVYRLESLVEPVMMKLVDGYCLFDHFVKE